VRDAGYFVEVADLEDDATRARQFGDEGCVASDEKAAAGLSETRRASKHSSPLKKGTGTETQCLFAGFNVHSSEPVPFSKASVEA
jgi:hypothetical protein